jgi:hypothetical protein
MLKKLCIELDLGLKWNAREKDRIFPEYSTLSNVTRVLRFDHCIAQFFLFPSANIGFRV